MPVGPSLVLRIRRDLADAEVTGDRARADRLRSILALITREERARRRPLDDQDSVGLLAGEVTRFRSLDSEDGDELAALLAEYLPDDRPLDELASALAERRVADAVVLTIRDLGANGPDQVDDVKELVRQRLGADIDECAVRREAERQLQARASARDGLGEDLDAGHLVSWTPLSTEVAVKEPPDLYPEHPGLVVAMVDARYVLVDWVERRQVADEAVYEVADLTTIDIEEYRRLTGEVVARDRAARLGRSEPGARLLADLGRADEAGDDRRAAVLRRVVTAIFAEVTRDEVARWRAGPGGDEVLAVITREAARLRVLADEGRGVPLDASAVLAEHVPEGVAVGGASAWLSEEEVAAIVDEAIREFDGSPTVDEVMALVRPRVGRRAYMLDVLREVRLRLM